MPRPAGFLLSGVEVAVVASRLLSWQQVEPPPIVYCMNPAQYKVKR